MSGAVSIFIYMIKNGFSFKGRINRREYWIFLLTFLVLLAVLLWFAAKIPVLSILVKAYCALMTIPIAAATARRLHDVEKSAKWLWAVLIPVFGWITIFVFTVGEGKSTYNRFGSRTDVICC